MNPNKRVSDKHRTATVLQASNTQQMSTNANYVSGSIEAQALKKWYNPGGVPTVNHDPLLHNKVDTGIIRCGL